MEWSKEAHPKFTLFQQDNARPNAARVIKASCRTKGLRSCSVCHTLLNSIRLKIFGINLVKRFPWEYSNQKNKGCWSRPCKMSRTLFKRSHKTPSVEYAHKMPSLCPGPGRPHLLSRTLSVHLFDHLLWFPIVCCSLDMGDSNNFSDVTFVSAPVWFINLMLSEFCRNCWVVVLQVLSKPYTQTFPSIFLLLVTLVFCDPLKYL